MRKPYVPNRPQARRSNVTISRQMAEAREKPQPPSDPTRVNRALYQEQQRRLGAMPRGFKAGNPNNPLGTPPESPSRLQCMLLSTADAVTATAWDSQREALLVANGTFIDVFVQETIYWHRIQSIDVGETVNKLSTYDSRLVIATPTKVIYRDDYRNQDTQSTISAVAVDVLSWSTAEDTNPSWPSEVTVSYQSEPPSATRGNTPNFPDDFLIVAEVDTVTIYDLASGAPVMWMVGLRTTQASYSFSWLGADNTGQATSIDYAEGRLYIGTQGGAGVTSSRAGLVEVDFALDRQFITTSQVAAPRRRFDFGIDQRNAELAGPFTDLGGTIVNSIVNDVAAQVLNSVETTNLLNASEDLTDAAWGDNAALRSATFFTEAAATTWHGVTQSNTFALGEYTVLSAKASPFGRDFLQMTYSSATHGVEQWANFDLVNGTIVNQGSAVEAAYILPSGDGEFYCYLVGVATSAGSSNLVWAAVQNAGDSRLPSTLGDPTKGLRLTNAQIEQSTTPHDYVASVTGPTTGTTPPARQLVNEDIGGGVLQTVDTGLFVPDWAVATDGGVSNGRDDGNVWDITGQINQTNFIAYSADGKIIYGGQVSSDSFLYDPLIGDINFAASTRRYFGSNNTTQDVGAPRILNNNGNSLVDVAAGAGLYYADDEGLTIIDEDRANYFNGAYTHVTAADPDGYNTGPMVDPLGAYANDSDTAPIGTPWVLYEDFDAPNVRVFSDNFNRTDPAPWFPVNSATLAIVDGELEITNAGFSAGAVLVKSAVNSWVNVKLDITSGASWQILVADNMGFTGSQSIVTGSGVSAIDETFFWSGDLYLAIQVNSATPGLVITADNVTIDQVPALDGWVPHFGGGAEIRPEGMAVSDDGQDPTQGRMVKAFPTDIGTTYDVTFDYTQLTTTGVVAISVNADGSSAYATSPAVGTSTGNTFSFTATTAVTYLACVPQTTQAEFGGIFDNITVQQDPAGTDTLPDNSGQGNDGLAIGQVTREKFNRCIYSVCTDDINYVRLTGASGDELQGWFKGTGETNYRFFEKAEEIDAIEKDGNDYLLKNGCYGLLVLTASPVDLGEFGPGFGEGFD